MANEIAVSALQAAALLYMAHEGIQFDTEDDKKFQVELLAKVNEICPELRMVVAGLKEKARLKEEH
jgi:hypothetical protein